MVGNGEPLFKYYMYVILAGVCWGLTGTLQGLAPEGASSMTVGSVRMAGAGFFLLIFAVAKRDYSILRQRWRWRGIFITAGAQLAYQLLFFSAARLAGVVLGTMITVGLAPAMAGFVGSVLYREKLTRRWYFSTAAAFTGCTMLVFGGAGQGIRPDFLGCLLAVGAALSYTFVGIGLRETGSGDPVRIATLVCGLAGIFALPILVMGDTSWMISPRGLGIVLMLVIAATILPLILFTLGVRRVPLGSAYTLSMTEPLTASLLAVFILRERMAPTSVLGAALMFFSIYVLTRSSK